jgi:hypothetical protein
MAIQVADQINVGRLVVNGDVLLRLQTSTTCPLHRYLSTTSPVPKPPSHFANQTSYTQKPRTAKTLRPEIAESWPNLYPKLFSALPNPCFQLFLSAIKKRRHETAERLPAIPTLAI